MMKRKIGEIKKAKEIGYKGTGRFTWQACRNCGKERWVLIEKGKPAYSRCHRCACPLNDKQTGYVIVQLSPSNFFYPMCARLGRIREHRLVMAKHLNRCLSPWEVVHHKNGIKNDNRIENLELLPDKKWHLVDVKTKSYIKMLEKKVITLQNIIRSRGG